MLKVLLTVDTEAYALSKDWQQDHLARDINRDIYGQVGARSVGLDYQLEVLNRFDLKAVFMVESLFSAVPEVGPGPLTEIISKVRAGGHEVQLHLHPEWIPYCSDLGIEFRSHLLREYTLEEQTKLIAFASKQLQACGAPPPIAFRAGGYAADANTITALARADMKFDSSFNIWYSGTKCHLPIPESYGRATPIGSVVEIPIAAIEDYPGHFRHAQICACGGNEMIHALKQAEANAWDFFVIVSHSFEMISRRRGAKPPFIRESVVRRFEKLCAFLSNNRHRFQTAGFEDLQQIRIQKNTGAKALPTQGRVLDTMGRVVEQLIHRIQSQV